MLLQISTKTDYVPKWNGNETDPEPIRVHHKVLSMSLRERLVPKPRLKVHVNMRSKDAKGGEEEVNVGETEVVIDNSNIIKTLVTKIDNLKVSTPNGGTLAISSAEDLFGEQVPTELQGLVDELGVYFQGLLNARVEEKNS